MSHAVTFKPDLLPIAVKEQPPAGQSSIFFPRSSSAETANISKYSSNVLPLKTMRSKSNFDTMFTHLNTPFSFIIFAEDGWSYLFKYVF